MQQDRVKGRILAKSEAKEWEKAVPEWRFLACTIGEHGKCECGRAIMIEVWIQNTRTMCTAIIGTHCMHYFPHLQKTIEHRATKDAVFCESALGVIRAAHYQPSQWETDFMDDIDGVHRLTPRQKESLRRIALKASPTAKDQAWFQV